MSPSISLTAIPDTSVAFHSHDPALQGCFDAAERRLAQNIVTFPPQRDILVEGGAYNGAWLETQPMGGAMSVGAVGLSAGKYGGTAPHDRSSLDVRLCFHDVFFLD